jgi:hypothetical protein
MIKKILLLLICINSTPFYANYSAGCGGGEDADITDISIFAPEIIRQKNVEPLFLTARPYYDPVYIYTDENGREHYDMETVTDKREQMRDSINLSEWMELLQHKLSREDVNWLVYGSSIPYMDSIIRYYNGRNDVYLAGIPEGIKVNIRKAKKIGEQLQYLRLAKLLEPRFDGNDGWSDNRPVYDYHLPEDSIAPVILRGYYKAQNVQLRARYAFQFLRYQFWNGSEGNENFFEQNVKFGPEVGSIYYRCLGYQAGILHKMGKFAESNYLYSLIYDLHEPLRLEGYYGFHVQEEEDWKNTLTLAKNAEEKEVLWELLGIYADPLRAMREIAVLNPGSQRLRLLMTRAVNKTELSLLYNPPYNDQWFFSSYSRDEDSSAAIELLEFMEEMSGKQQTVDRTVWKTSAAFLALVVSDFTKCRYWLDELKKEKISDSLLLGQNQITEAILHSKSVLNPGETEEAEMLRLIQNIKAYSNHRQLRISNALRYLHRSMGYRYREQGQMVKAELSSSSGGNYFFSSADAQRMIDFALEKDHSDFEKYLLKQYELNINQMYSMLALTLVQEARFSEAVTLIEKMQLDYGGEHIDINPFLVRAVDCFDCYTYDAPEDTGMNQYQFTVQMKLFKERLDRGSDMEDRALAAFSYGSGLYNMSWFGHGRRDINYSGVYTELNNDFHYTDTYYEYGLSREGFVEIPGKRKSRTNLLCREALKYYEKARSLTRDVEFKAKCAWMCAKCEHGIWLEENYLNDKENFKAGKWFKVMAEEHANTQYHAMVLKECGYFCTYSGGGEECIRFK